MVSGSQVGEVQKGFASLGEVPGKTRSEIEAVVGPPSSISGMPNGGTLLQWQIVNQAGGYHIAMAFDADGICEGITHESAV